MSYLLKIIDLSVNSLARLSLTKAIFQLINFKGARRKSSVGRGERECIFWTKWKPTIIDFRIATIPL